jgi:uncharacterized DUF497 family protein
MRFERDERKREANLVKHGLDFLDAELIFRRRSTAIHRSATARTRG